MKTYVLEREVVLPRPRDTVFPFFADPRNLERITPPWLSFELTGWEQPARGTATAEVASGVEASAVGEPVMEEGLRLHYRIRPVLVPQRWVSEITVWDPPFRFTDEQVRGPYRLWRHAHQFEAVPAGTVIRDRVEYALPFGPLGQLAHLLLVQHQLKRIFDFRLEVMNATFGLDHETETS